MTKTKINLETKILLLHMWC